MMSHMDEYPGNDMVMAVWALTKMRVPGRGQILAKLGLKIAFKGWLAKAPQGFTSNSNSNSNWDPHPSQGLKAKDVAHLLWTYADDRASWVTLAGRMGACRVVGSFIKEMTLEPDRYDPGDLCRVSTCTRSRTH
jgi:hypothetical protein